MIYINDRRMVPSEFMKFEENDEATEFVDFFEELDDSETKD